VVLDSSVGPVWCKLEFLNPSGSTKDRIAAYILMKAWRAGHIGSGASVVEASSGSTSIALAMVCAQMGLHYTAVMPESVSNERVLMIRTYGGTVVLSPAAQGIQGALQLAREISESSGAFLPRQFENPDNAAAHRFGTAREICQQIPEGVVDVVVSGVGTGGTLMGLYHGCRDHGCEVIPVAARPTWGKGTSGFGEAECCSFSPRIPGVVENVSTLYRREDLSGLVEVEVEDEHALSITRALHARGFPVGPSSGLNFAAAIEFRRRCASARTVVTVFPDRMERYFSTELFAVLNEAKFR
jgi:cysteine synthase A